MNQNNGAQTRAGVVSKTFSAKKFFNVANVLDNISRIGAPRTANPSEKAFFAMSILVTVEYIVVFSEPRELAQS